MIFINLQNVEDLIFFDPKARSFLSDLTHVIDQWLLSQRIPALRSLRQQAKMDLLNSLTSDHVAKLEEYFGDTIVLDTVDYHIVRHYKFPLDVSELDRELTAVECFGNFAVSRNEDCLYISFWR